MIILWGCKDTFQESDALILLKIFLAVHTEHIAMSELFTKVLPKMKTLQRIVDKGIVAVVRAESAEQAEKIARACIDGGVDTIEITFTVPGAHKVIEGLRQALSEEEL